MIRNSVVVKLWLTFIVVVVVVLSLLTVFLEQLLDQYFYREQVNALMTKAGSVNRILETYSPNQQLPLEIANLMEQDNRTSIIYLPGDDPEVSTIINSLDQDKRKQLFAGSSVVTGNDKLELQKVPPGKENLWAFSLFNGGGSDQGLLVMNQLVSAAQPAINEIRSLIFFAASFGIVLTTGLAFVVSKNLSRPLIQMNRVAERMAEGDFAGQIDIVTGDEVGQLGTTLNKMAAALLENIKELQKQSEQSHSILTSMADGVVSAGLDGAILLVNPQAKALLSALTENPGSQADDRSRLPADLLELQDEVISKQTPVGREFSWGDKSIYVSMTPLFEPDHRGIRGIVAVLRDITQERMLEEMRKDFVANVSHELRTPLSLLQGYSEALLDDFGDDPVQRQEITNIILDETHRMRRLVGDLLDLAQLQSGHFLLQVQDVSIDQLCRRVSRKFSTLAAEKQIRFEYKGTRLPLAVNGDADRLEQVLTNLLDNAIRHTPVNGLVCLSILAEQTQVSLEVSDTGSGIPAEDLPYIFERFYKVDKARTRSKSGTGLGLSIAYNIVKQHGGKISVQSKLNEGTTFRVELPYTGRHVEQDTI
ncbi:MAG: histidine kinase [Bacilli bacterium]|nr:histidine kinase [Bacilli bacterium]